MAPHPASIEPGRQDPAGVPRLGLAPLDVLSQLERAATDQPLRPLLPQIALSAPPPNVVVTAATPGPDGVAPDDSGLTVAAEHRIDLVRRLNRAEATGAAGEATVVDLEDDTTAKLVVIGLGDGSVADARKAGATMARHIGGAERVLCAATSAMSREGLGGLCESLILASYTFTRRRPAASATVTPFVQLAVASVARAQPVLDRAVARARSTMFARELGNTPSAEKTPRWMAQRAADLAAETGEKLTVFDAARLERDGFGGILAVGQGSIQPPCLIMIEHRGEAGAPHVVLVGKGITFDSGGLSLKSTESMALMKTDMAGAAAVMGVMRALPALGVTARVTALLPAAENMPSGSAMRPGDVVTHFGGRTSEVRNTDAEGRLVLADALAFAQLRLKPDAIVDVATLTGAATMTFGRSVAALFSNDEGLAGALENAGTASGERAWSMPLAEEYRPPLRSDIADIANTARKPGPGAIQAALFLEEFIDGKRWAHLDIAGPARSDKQVGDISRGATGFGVRLLLRWLEGSPDLW